MKTLVLIACIVLTSFMSVQKKQRILFFGDSITEAAVKPGGFITLMGDMLKQKGIDANYELVGAGVSGNKVYDLYLRMEEDVLAKNPDAVVIWIGVNDVWHKRTSGTGTDADKFEGFYNTIIKKLQAKNIKVFVCTPAAIGEKTDYSNEQDGDLNKYAIMIRSIAKNNNCELIDLRKFFLDYNLANNKDNKPNGILTGDGVHLNATGNKAVAEEMMKQVIKQ